MKNKGAKAKSKPLFSGMIASFLISSADKYCDGDVAQYVLAKKLFASDKRTAIWLWLSAAKKGHVGAMHELISAVLNKQCHEYITEIEQLAKDYVYTYNDIEAKYFLGKVLLSRDLSQRQEAMFLLADAAIKGHVDAMRTLNEAARNKQLDPVKLIDFLRNLAEQGNANACYYLGEIYNFGTFANILPVSSDKAIEYWKTAAEQNHVGAKRELGFYALYCEKDADSKQKTIFWLGQAAEQGDCQAQYTLAHIYAEGRYVTKDLEQAARLYGLAASQDYSDAKDKQKLILRQIAAEKQCKHAQTRELIKWCNTFFEQRIQQCGIKREEDLSRQQSINCVAD